jgi:hypothetical protein
VCYIFSFCSRLSLFTATFSFILVSRCGVRLSPLVYRPALGLLRMRDDAVYGTRCRMGVSENGSTRRKTAPVPPSPPQISQDFTRLSLEPQLYVCSQPHELLHDPRCIVTGSYLRQRGGGKMLLLNVFQFLPDFAA